MDWTVAAAFVMAAMSGSFSPGPNNLMVMTSSAKFGVVRTIPHAAGVVVGFPLMVFVVGLGLGEIFTAYPEISSALRYAAAAYFLWMAWTMLGIRIGKVEGAERPMRLYEAVLFQWINPKAWVMAIGFVAAFVPPGEGRMAALALVTAGSGLITPASLATWMVFGKGLVAFLRRTGTERYLGWILAALLIVAVFLFIR